MAIWRMSQGPDGHGSVSASYGEGAFHLNVTVEGATAFAGSARLRAIALWVAGPPLALWLLWLWRRPDRAVASPSVSTLQPTESAAALPSPGMEPIEVGRRERQAAERGRQR